MRNETHKPNKMYINFKWIDNTKRKPKKGDEYLVVWNLKDGYYPVTSSMDWDAIKKVWTDPRCHDKERDEQILFWAEQPKPPRGIKKHVYDNDHL